MPSLFIAFVQRIPRIDVDVHDNGFHDEQGGVDHHEQNRERGDEIGNKIAVGHHHDEQEQSTRKRGEAIAEPDDFRHLMRQALELEIRLCEHDAVG